MSDVAVLSLPRETVSGLVEVLAMALEHYDLPYCWLHANDVDAPLGVVLSTDEFRRLRKEAGEPLKED